MTDAAIGVAYLSEQEFAEYVALVRDEPLIELDIDKDNPALAAEVRFQALTPEQQAYRLNEAADHMGARQDWVVVAGHVVSESSVAYAHLCTREAALSRSYTRPVAVVVPLARARSFGRERRSHRVAVRRSSSCSSGDRESEPPASRPDLETLAATVASELHAVVVRYLRVQVEPVMAELREITAALERVA